MEEENSFLDLPASGHAGADFWKSEYKPKGFNPVSFCKSLEMSAAERLFVKREASKCFNTALLKGEKMSIEDAYLNAYQALVETIADGGNLFLLNALNQTT